jgi:hypothetical protein
MSKTNWTICNLADIGMRYGRFDSEDAAVQAAREQSATGEVIRIDHKSGVVDFRGTVRL